MARSANLDFFAAEADQRAVLDFLFSSTDVRVFESYSEYTAELWEFRSTDELATTFVLGTNPQGNGHAVLRRGLLRELRAEKMLSDAATFPVEIFVKDEDGRVYLHRAI